MSILWPNGKTTKPAVSSRYGAARGGGRIHMGTDFVGYSTLHAITAGKVTQVGLMSGGAGQAIVYDAVIGGRTVTVCHFHVAAGTIRVKRGDRVKAGQAIGTMGDTGNATGNCDHLEIRFWDNGRLSRANPETWLAARIDSTTPADGGITPIGDEDMAHMELVQTPDGTVWFCYDRIFRYAIPNSRNLDTYVAHLAALGKSTKLIQKSASDITAYGSPIYADPLNRFAEGRDVSAAQTAIIAAIGKIPTSGGGGTVQQPDLAPALTALAAALKQLTDAIK
ncbi:MAG: M23 family metallopeptidase [Homoserinimonas sp.]